MLIDYTQRGKCISQGKKSGSLRQIQQKTQLVPSDSSSDSCPPSQSPPMCSESNLPPMILSFTSIDSDKVEDDPEHDYETISFFLTFHPDDHDDCQGRVESGEDPRKRGIQRNKIAQTLSPRPRRNALILYSEIEHRLAMLTSRKIASE